MGDKYYKLGQVIKVLGKDDVERKKVKLGQEGSKDPKYDYTVQVRILQGSPRTKEEFKNAKVLGTFTNPWVDLYPPHEKAPKNIISDLQIFEKEII